jgi:hypothetical protein
VSKIARIGKHLRKHELNNRNKTTTPLDSTASTAHVQSDWHRHPISPEQKKIKK